MHARLVAGEGAVKVGGNMSRVLTQQVLTYEERLYCTECDGDHEMHWNNVTLTVSPPLYPHICEYCEHRENIRGVVYPITRQVPTGDTHELNF